MPGNRHSSDAILKNSPSASLKDKGEEYEREEGAGGGAREKGIIVVQRRSKLHQPCPPFTPTIFVFYSCLFCSPTSLTNLSLHSAHYFGPPTLPTTPAHRPCPPTSPTNLAHQPRPPTLLTKHTLYPCILHGQTLFRYCIITHHTTQQRKGSGHARLLPPLLTG